MPWVQIERGLQMPLAQRSQIHSQNSILCFVERELLGFARQQWFDAQNSLPLDIVADLLRERCVVTVSP